MGKHKHRDKHRDDSEENRDKKKQRTEDDVHHHGRKYHRGQDVDYSTEQMTDEHVNVSSSSLPSGQQKSEELPGKKMGKLPIELCEPDFPWTEYRRTLNKIFFRDEDKIQRGTMMYDDFWCFLSKYQSMQSKAKMKAASEHSTKMGDPKNLFCIDPEVMNDMLIRGHLFKDDRRSKLSQERLTEFQYVINLYFKFVEKKKALKLEELQKAQENLPIRKYKEEILDGLQKNQVIVVAGDTGCGKSTQVPQYLLAAGYTSIACTQPRRIACIALCNRVAYETQNEYGSEVGYQIRFEKNRTSNTKILFITEGLLLRQVSIDPMLSNYNVIILDEVHERHLPSDFLLGIMKCLTIQRPELKIVLMSATINIELFTEYFNNCPVIQVPGRLFPIQVRHIPIRSEEQKTQTGRLNPAPYLRIMNLIDHQFSETERGDLLIFLSGMAEISAIEEAARTYAEQTNRWIILPLHSTLSLEQQDKVFDIAPESVRKCIISTNIAETSVTIDGIRFVVDSGKVKEMSYDPSCRMQRLQEFWISQASAEQRKGRAGRTGPGVCFRMYSEQEFDTMSVYSKPEIQRVPLDSIILQMMSIGLPDARKFPFLEPPSLTSIEESVQSLKDQGALTDDETLTPMGKMLSRLPVEVTVGKMLVHGSLFSLVEPVLSLVAALSVQSPFSNRTNRDPDLMAARKLLDSDHGDPFTLLNSYHNWLEVKSDRRCDSRQWCRSRGLEEQRFYDMSKLRRQFKDLLKDASLLPEEHNYVSSYDRSHRHGELRHLKDMKKQYHQAPRARKVLKVESLLNEFADADDDNDGRIDIKDVEFRMTHNQKQVHELSSSSKITSYREVICLKLIVCSGLYPQFAIADINNSFKPDCDQYFHTKAKPFTVLHPNGVFALQPDLLELNEHNVEEIKGFRSQSLVSKRHELLSYMSLLETKKPFLMNCLRVSAAHILLLLSHSVDTNEDFTRIVCDKWLELRFPKPQLVREFVTKAMHIRDAWESLLKKTFEDFVLDKEKGVQEIHKMGRSLCHTIADFFMTEIPYCIRRLLAADIRHMYITPSAANLDAASRSQGQAEGRAQVKGYLNYNCLIDLEDQHLEHPHKAWVCPHCEQEIISTVLDQIRHKEKCGKNQDLGDNKVAVVNELKQQRPFKRPYFCGICNEHLQLTGTETLRHKRSHSKA